MKMSKISFLSGILLFILIIPFCKEQFQCEEECDRCLLYICPASGGCPEYFITWEEPENFDPHRNWLRYWSQLRVLDQNDIQERPFLDVYLLKIQKVGI